MKKLSAVLFIFTHFLATSALAQQVTLGKGAGNVAAILAVDARVHTHAFHKALKRSALTTRHGNDTQSVAENRPFLRRLKAKVQGATLARFDYVPTGTHRTLIVHSRSGKSIDATLAQVARTKGEDTSGSTSEAGGSISDAETVADVGDARFYPVDTADMRRAVNRPMRESWVVEATPSTSSGAAGRIINGSDAELKALRQLEYEFEQDSSLASQGGRLVGYVSKTVCNSCHAAMEEFAKHYNVDMQVYYLDETSNPASATAADVFATEDINVASRAGSAFLRGLRQELTHSYLSAPLPDMADNPLWSAAYDVQQIYAAARGDGLASLPRCVPE